MMKTLKLIVVLFLMPLLLTSCGGDEPVAPDDSIVPENPDVSDKPASPEITIPDGEDDYFSKGMIFQNDAGEKELVFHATSDWKIDVSATRNGEEWCSVSPSSGKAGNQVVKVKVTENTAYDDRNISLSISAGTTKKNVAVTQKQQEALPLAH